jgi:hypothetical protein
MRHQAITQHAEARRQHINREHARLAELQYTVDTLRHQEQRQQPNANSPPPNYPIPPPPPPNHYIPHHQPPSPPHNQYIPLPPQFGTTDPKNPLVIHLQLAPWLLHYQSTPPPKYHRNAGPYKFLISYGAAIASAGGDEATLAKSQIISLEDAITNWYSRLPPGCIYSWPQLKEKFMLNFQEFQMELDSEEDFLSCIQREKETLLNFYRRFLLMKAQASEVSDDQVIA